MEASWFNAQVPAAKLLLFAHELETISAMRAGVSKSGRRTESPAIGKSFGVLIFALCASTMTFAQTQDLAALEYKVKAGFLYNFAKLAEWPTNAFAAADSPIIMGVLGKDPFGPVLDGTVRDKTVGGRKLVIQRFKVVNEVTDCHVLFICGSEQDRLGSTLAHLASRSILTVSDLDNFAHRGGMIGLVKNTEALRFEINLGAVERANLRLSSKLLRLAKVVLDKHGCEREYP